MDFARGLHSRAFIVIGIVGLSLSTTLAQNSGAYSQALAPYLALDIANAQGYANVGFSPAIISISGRPFTAKRTYTDHRYGSDPADVSADCTIARDEKGRIHYEMAFEGNAGGKVAIVGYDVEIHDPVAHILVRYFMTADHGLPHKSVATVRVLKLVSELTQRLPPPPASKPSEVSGSISPENEIVPSPSDLLADRTRLENALPEEDLPRRLFGGVSAIGHRSVIRYGQKQEFFQIQENWFSPSYAVDMGEVILRESIGKETRETHDLVGGAPDAALFEVPPGYTIRRER